MLMGKGQLTARLPSCAAAISSDDITSKMRRKAAWKCNAVGGALTCACCAVPWCGVVSQVIGGGLRDSFLVKGVAFKKTFSYAGFEQQPKAFDSESPAAQDSTRCPFPLPLA